MSGKINKNGKGYPLGFMPEHYPADRVYLDGDTSKTVQDYTVKTADYNVTFSNNGDYGITLPGDCNIPISCHIVEGWKTVSLYNYSNSWGFHSAELAGTTQKVRLIYV